MNFKTFNIFEDVPQQNFEDQMYQSLVPENILPTNFVGLILGKPGAGKTFLASKLLQNKNAFYKKYDILLIQSPHSIEQIPFDSQYWSKTFSIDWLKERLNYFKQLKDFQNQNEKKPKKKVKYADMISTNESTIEEEEDQNSDDNENVDQSAEVDNNSDNMSDTDETPSKQAITKKLGQSKLARKVETKNKFKNQINSPHNNNIAKYKALIILDDVIADIKKMEHSPEIQRMFFNRRHWIPGVEVSFLVTAQNYKRLPNMFRSILTFIIMFNIPPKDLKYVADEQIYNNNSGIREIIQQHFKQQKHNFVYIRLDKYTMFLNFERLCS